MKTVILLLSMIMTLLADIGAITAVKGSAELQHQGSVQTVQKGLGINTEDLLVTASASKVQVILNDNTVITIGPESQYLFERYDDGENPEVSMELKRGFFKVITGKIGKIAPKRFTVKTRSAVIGIRGTQFMASLHDDEEIIACTKGRISVTTLDRVFEINRGEMLSYSDGAWQKTPIEMRRFTPVSVKKEVKSDESDTLRNSDWSYMPGLENSDALQEQIIKNHDDEREGFLPFDFGGFQEGGG